MPFYECTTVSGRLTPQQRAGVADVITTAHHRVTGAPAYFVRVAFHEADPASVFVAGAAVAHDHVFVFGHIRAGRDAATRAALTDRIAEGVCRVADLDRRGLWIYLSELTPANMVEFGHRLPASGEEEAWEAALPAEDRAWFPRLGR